jgi:GDSL-like Lipase/Acylhydrolase family
MKFKFDLKEFLQNSFATLVSIFVTFLILEVGTRIYLFHFASEETFTTFASLRQLDKYAGQVGKDPVLSHHRYLGYYLTPNYKDGVNRHNALGYRGDEIIQPKPPGEFRILCIGGSTTYTTRVDDYQHSYPDRMEQELIKRGYTNVNVINTGVPGWDTWNMTIDFELRGLDLNPDLIIYYEAVNDIKPRLVWPPEVYRGDNSGRNAPMVSRVHMPSILEYSTAIRMVLILLNAIEPHTSYSTIDRTQDTYVGDEFHRQLKTKSYPSDFFTKVSIMDILKANPPIYYQRNIENIAAIAKARNIKVMLATFAFVKLPTDDRVSSPEYIFALNEHNAVIKNIAQKMQVNVFDFASVFPKEAQYFDDGVHVNVPGAQLKGQLFADYLDKSGLIPKPNAQPVPAQPTPVQPAPAKPAPVKPTPAIPALPQAPLPPKAQPAKP